jgi:oxygen-independent coproporphyrinogen-3 oxidase
MMSFPEPRAVYIHVPFCVHRCGYCDFTLVANRDDLIGDYLNALECEMESLGSIREVDTLFFGGGTPTQLRAEELQRLFEIVNRWFVVTDGGEVSTEANPDGLSDAKIDVLADAGVNRVSLGIQSFDADTLKTLERIVRTTFERRSIEFANESTTCRWI